MPFYCMTYWTMFNSVTILFPNGITGRNRSEAYDFLALDKLVAILTSIYGQLLRYLQHMWLKREIIEQETLGGTSVRSIQFFTVFWGPYLFSRHLSSIWQYPVGHYLLRDLRWSQCAPIKAPPVVFFRPFCISPGTTRWGYGDCPLKSHLNKSSFHAFIHVTLFAPWFWGHYHNYINCKTILKERGRLPQNKLDMFTHFLM